MFLGSFSPLLDENVTRSSLSSNLEIFVILILDAFLDVETISELSSRLRRNAKDNMQTARSELLADQVFQPRENQLLRNNSSQWMNYQVNEGWGVYNANNDTDKAMMDLLVDNQSDVCHFLH